MKITRLLKPLLLIIITFIALFFISLLTVAKPLYALYETHILHANYEGETLTLYYLTFLQYYLLPGCLLLAVVIIWLVYRFKGNKN